MQRRQSGLRLEEWWTKPKQTLLQEHITNGYCLVKGKHILEMMNLKKNNSGRRKKKRKIEIVVRELVRLIKSISKTN